MGKKANTVDNYEFSIVPSNAKKGNIACLTVTPEICARDLDATLALALSIKKHNFIVENKQAMKGASDGDCDTCALCQWNLGLCDDCIIGQAAGQTECRGTPYWQGKPEDELEFLLALQLGGVEAGRDWLTEWQNREQKDG